MTLTKTDKSAIVTELKGLPPDLYKDYCNTEDRLRHWEECRTGFMRMAIVMNAYFTGQPELMNEIPSELRAPFIKCRNRYLALYTLIFDGWEHIKQAAIENNLPIPESPLLMLFQIFEDWCLDTFLILFPESITGNSYSEFSPNKEHSQKREHDNLIRIIKGIEPLGRDELRRIERYKKRTSESQKLSKFEVREYFCIQACIQSSKKDKITKENLKQFNRVDAIWETDLFGSLHPRKKPRGFGICKGNKLELRTGRLFSEICNNP